MHAKTLPLIGLICACLLFSGCSKSAVKLLEAGNASACASKEVTDQVVEIVKQQSGIPGGQALIPDYADTLSFYLGKISFSVSEVTSISVDQPNRKASCNLKLVISESGDTENSAAVDYTIAADLYTGRPIVIVDVSSAKTKLNEMLANLTKPIVDDAREKRRVEASMEADNYEKSWTLGNVGKVESVRREVSKQIVPGRFTNQELSSIFRARRVDKQCSEAIGRESELICQRSREIYADFSGKICKQFDRWYHCDSKNEEKADLEAFSAPVSLGASDASNNLQDPCVTGAGERLAAEECTKPML